ncbi:hypothetical protein E4U02_10995 [Microbacterium paludicola]|uniref:Scramblase n=1 Tax=Microbacterium paludicola TaxID=300019 RepID=A0A4Y9FV14_9MICO|nr:LURP-one-related family protein [Microbacterium paludicola]MBF0816939.1 LURP-one-related family protein [Microbacterium paludicola]TFU32383.1 hypothetical protein E4U02_10995 [Microbacterium paludicola]
MSVLTHDQLVFQQTRNFSKNDFAILDPQGQQVAHVETGGSALGRAFMGARELTVFDGPDNPLVQVKDVVTLGRDRMEILDGTGNPLASLVKRITLFKTRVTLDVQGEQVDLLGDIWGFDFQFTGPDGVWATVSRAWSGVGNAFLGKSTYAVSLAPGLDAARRQIVIGSVLALDLIREKQEQKS